MIKYSIPAIVALFATPVVAQHVHETPNNPVETGQSAFAAISEIVQILLNEQETDWSRVNIQELREHLSDMNHVTTSAMVETFVNGEVVEFRVSGEGRVTEAIKRMVSAHSPMLETATGWIVTSSETETGALMRVATKTEQEFERVVGLGFFGLMTIGAHHQSHHLQLASGSDPHH